MHLKSISDSAIMRDGFPDICFSGDIIHSGSLGESKMELPTLKTTQTRESDTRNRLIFCKMIESSFEDASMSMEGVIKLCRKTNRLAVQHVGV